MSTNPFYRFENSAWNTAFEPAFTPTVDALYDFIVDIFDGLFVGSSLSFALTFIKNKIIQRNAPPYHFNFELIPPSPLPPVGTGTQYWSYYITEKQLYSLHPTQKFQIDFTTVNGVITVTNVTANPDISYPYSYSLPLYQTEIEAYRALEIAHQNGAAFFPSEYIYDSTTGIATSSVARLQDCKFNEATGFGERYPLITAPVSPYWGLSVPAMSADEKYMILLLNKIITYGLDSTKTAIDINIFVVNLILPEGYYLLGGYDLTGYPRVQYTFSNPTTREAVGIIGRFDIVWNWQRFYSAGIDDFFTSNLAVMEATSPTTPLPYPPILGKSYSTFIEEKKNWYDFEQMEFIDACAIPVEYYPMPAKTADHFQFNVIPSMSNTNDLNYSKIGLFDCQENFIQEIGILKQPDCHNENFSLVLTNEEYEVFSDSDGDFIIIGYDCNSLETYNLTIPFSSITSSPNTAFAQSIIDYINSFNNIIATYTIDGSSNIIFNLFLNGYFINTKTFQFELNGVPVLDVYMTLEDSQAVASSWRSDIGPNGRYYINDTQMYFWNPIIASGIISDYNSNYDPLTGIYTNTFDSTINQQIKLRVEVQRAFYDDFSNGALWTDDSDGMQDDCRIYVFRSKSPNGIDYVGTGSETFGPNMSLESWFPFDENYIPTDGSVANTCLFNGKRYFSTRNNNTEWTSFGQELDYIYTCGFNLETDIILNPPLRIGEQLIVYVASGPYKKLWDGTHNIIGAYVYALYFYDGPPPFYYEGFRIKNNPDININTQSTGVRCLESTQFQASIDIPSVATGEYKLGLYNQSETALEIYATSNPIRIDNSDCFSNIIEFYGNSNSIAQGFEYYGDWRQRIRIGLNGGGAKPRITEATYRQSNGVFKRPQNKQDLTLDLHTDFFDEPTQFAMTDATRHPFLVWNDKNIFVEGDIEVATVQDFTTQSSFEDLAQMKFSVLVQGFQPKNNSCINC